MSRMSKTQKAARIRELMDAEGLSPQDVVKKNPNLADGLSIVVPETASKQKARGSGPSTPEQHLATTLRPIDLPGL